MANWKYVKIGDVCTVERGGSPRPIDKFITDDPNGINWIKIGDTDDSMYITKTAQKIIPEGIKKSRYVQPGDFLLSNSMSFGRPYILKIDGCIHDGWLVLRDNNGIFDKRFLYYYLSSPSTYQKFKNMAVGGVVNNLNSEMVRGVTLPVPTMEEQLSIVSALDKVIELITLRKEQLTKLDRLVKSRFIELFGEPIANQKNLPVKTLKEISTLITNGNTPKGGSENYVENGITFLRSQNVWRNNIVLDDVAYIDEETHESMKKSSVHYKDILITKTGRINTENSSLGRAALYLGEDDSANINGHVYLVRLDDTVVPEYVVTILTGEAYRRYIRKVCVGGIDKRQINLDQVEEFPIILPLKEQQEQFADFVRQIDKSKLAIQQSLNKLESLKKSLMQEYFG